ncbi:Hypothetical predicted protein [Mytilus galloprovincialis]|uniref:Uncharacterized protein n=1 Tax=Mytilus galloprovincialis TaxID=29158 RepID=A0A8B6HKN9_MYTGA|nr:Hypothetical predicted protein [Mytilus galloprovincialis]
MRKNLVSTHTQTSLLPVKIIFLKTKGVPIPFGDHLDWSAFDGLLKINPTVEIKETIDTPGRKAANVQLPGLAELPPIPRLNGQPPAVVPAVTLSPATTKTTRGSTKTFSTNPATQPKVSNTPTIPPPTTTRTTQQTPTVPVRTLPPTQPPTPPPTQPPTPPTTTEATPAPPVIMVQHSLSGISGPSNIISQAQEWIDGSRESSY